MTSKITSTLGSLLQGGLNFGGSLQGGLGGSGSAGGSESSGRL
jgi:hypothetical protein